MSFQIRELQDADREWLHGLLKEHWGGPVIVTRGRLHQADQLPGFVAIRQSERVGALTYRVDEDQLEVVSLNSLEERQGIGTALLMAAVSAARAAGCHLLRLVTTNDNTAAIEFYRHRGLRLIAVRHGAVEAARRLKPEIPEYGADGVRIRDEIEFEREVGPEEPPAPAGEEPPERISMMPPDPSVLLRRAGIRIAPLGFYDAPDSAPFEPVVEPPPDSRVCLFAFYPQWAEGRTLRITRENFGCGGAGAALCGVLTRSREDYLTFLVDEEGLKVNRDAMGEWFDQRRPYPMRHQHLLFGPLRADQYEYLRTVTFFVNPDQLGLLMTGAQYNRGASGPPPVVARFSSGCGQIASIFDDLEIPQAAIGATDIAMRQFLPPDVLALTVTRPLFEELCRLGERSFLYRPFWQRLQKARDNGEG